MITKISDITDSIKKIDERIDVVDVSKNKSDLPRLQEDIITLIKEAIIFYDNQHKLTLWKKIHLNRAMANLLIWNLGMQKKDSFMLRPCLVDIAKSTLEENQSELSSSNKDYEEIGKLDQKDLLNIITELQKYIDYK